MSKIVTPHVAQLQCQLKLTMIPTFSAQFPNVLGKMRGMAENKMKAQLQQYFSFLRLSLQFQIF